MGMERKGAGLDHVRITKMQPFLISHDAMTRTIVRYFSAPL